MIFKLLFFIFNTIIKAQDDFIYSPTYHSINQVVFQQAQKSQTLNNKFDNSGILLAFQHFDLTDDFSMFDMKPQISQDNKSVTFSSNKPFSQISYRCLVLDLSKFNNISIKHDSVEITKADKKDEQSGIIEYIFFKDLEKKLEKYKIKEVYAFLTGFSTGNNSNYQGISIDLSVSVEQNRIKLSIKSRKSYIDLNFVYFNYIVQFIDDLNLSQYELKTVFDQQLSSDVYPQLLNGYGDRLINIQLDIKQEQILKDFKSFLFIGGNKIDFIITKGQLANPRFYVNFEDNVINNQVQFTAKTWYMSKCNGFSIFVFKIYYKQCKNNKYFYKDKCYDQCPKATYQAKCFDSCPNGTYKSKA